MKTSTPKLPAPTWYVVDATDQTIGRIATKAAHVLRGKHKATFSPNSVTGDHVIVLNIEKMKVDPMKAMKKMYYKHSGYLGSMQVKSLEKMMESKPEQVMEKAVYGMLPRNRQRLQMMKRLHVLQGTEHKYAPQQPVSLSLSFS